jgi:hypothetical protein
MGASGSRSFDFYTISFKNMGNLFSGPIMLVNIVWLYPSSGDVPSIEEVARAASEELAVEGTVEVISVEDSGDGVAAARFVPEGFQDDAPMLAYAYVFCRMNVVVSVILVGLDTQGGEELVTIDDCQNYASLVLIKIERSLRAVQ